MKFTSILRLVTALACAIVSCTSLAGTVSNVSITNVGIADNSYIVTSPPHSVAYFMVAPTISGCYTPSGYNASVIYIDLEAQPAFGKQAYTTVLMAKSLGMKLSSVTYSTPSTNVCLATLIELQP